MGLRKKTSQPEADVGTPQQLKVRKRIRAMGDAELFDWLDAALYPVGRGISEARKGLAPTGLTEAREGMMTFLEVLDELIRRRESDIRLEPGEIRPEDLPRPPMAGRV
jgi:hypothetical protein